MLGATPVARTAHRWLHPRCAAQIAAMILGAAVVVVVVVVVVTVTVLTVVVVVMVGAARTVEVDVTAKERRALPVGAVVLTDLPTRTTVHCYVGCCVLRVMSWATVRLLVTATLIDTSKLVVEVTLMATVTLTTLKRVMSWMR